MRTLHIILAGITIACGALLFAWRSGLVNTERERIEATRAALLQMDAQLKYRAATSRSQPTEAVGAKVNARGWPVTIESDWFGKTPPLNLLAPPGSPWVEVASTEELGLNNPPLRVALDKNTAGFWYNPALGLIRARVGPTTSDKRAVEIYNEVNRTSVATIVEAGPASADTATAEVDGSQH